MTFTAKDVLQPVVTTLQDSSNRRWSLDELRIYLNDGLREIALLKPSAVSESKRITLQEGTLQELPDGEYLLRVIRNITSADGAAIRTAGPAITTIDRSMLDMQFSNWHDSAVVPFSATVLHVMIDEENPRRYYVYPGNDGTGVIEAVVSTIPAPVSATATPTDIDTYGSKTVDIPDLYQSALRDYILSRAYEKDAAIPGAAQRAVAYRQAFNATIGAKQQVEMANTINTDT